MVGDGTTPASALPLSTLTLDADGNIVGNAATATSIKPYSIGTLSGKTIADFRDAIRTWMSGVMIGARATFAASNAWITKWNNEDLTSTLAGGTTWVIEKVDGYNYDGYAKFRISAYGAVEDYYTGLSNYVWSPVVQDVTIANIGNQSVAKATNDGNGNNIADTYLPKVTVSDGFVHLYAVDGSNQKTYKLSSSGLASTVALRSSNGTVKGAAPIEGNDLTTKAYVDDAVANAGGGSDIVYSPNGTMLSQKPDGDGSFEFVNEPANITSKQFTEATRVGTYAVTLGGKSAATGKRALAEGTSTWAKGNYSHAEGNKSLAEGAQAHAEGAQTYAQGDESHSEGYMTHAQGLAAHAEGAGTLASGAHSHAEGGDTVASNEMTHAEGVNTVASGYASHAEGNHTQATHDNSHTSGWYTRSSRKNQTVVGQSNKDDADALFIVGNGPFDAYNAPSESYRSNAFAVMAYTTDPAIKLGNTQMTETQLQGLLNGGGGSSGPVDWDDITNKPNVVILEDKTTVVSYPYPATTITEVPFGSGSTQAQLRDPDFCANYPNINGIGAIGCFIAGGQNTYESGATFERNANYWVIKHPDAPGADNLVAIGIITPGTYTFGATASGTFVKTGLYMISHGGYWWSETLNLVDGAMLSEEVIPDVYVKKEGDAQISGSLAVGNNVLAGAQNSYAGGQNSITAPSFADSSSVTTYQNSQVTSLELVALNYDSSNYTNDYYLKLSGVNIPVGSFINGLKINYGMTGTYYDTEVSGEYTADGVFFMTAGSGYLHGQTVKAGESFTVNSSITAVASSAHGVGLIASRSGQCVVGTYNKRDDDALLVVGKGTSNNSRSNAFAVRLDNGTPVLQVGNTTITETQLQQLLALLNIQNAEEVEF